ncbi:chaperonin [Lactobacillus iners]|uniref:chaperonin n=1 Tax=Lactobacillus iners TaxID=147802 RepID=UPI0029C4BB86|nr:chaperonin [Lactobacillus iners]MDX5067193.1 chaperonin [Lactobacillus iners]MDX5085093.1 chaperonin [Lactobacillus iners]
MIKAIKVTEKSVILGFPDGTAKEVPIADFDCSVHVGDEFEMYEMGDKKIFSKKAPKTSNLSDKVSDFTNKISSDEGVQGFIDNIVKYDVNNLFDKILLAIFSVLGLNIIYILYISSQCEASIGSALSCLSNLSSAFAFQNFVVFCAIAALVIKFLELKDGNKWKKAAFVFPAVTVVVTVLMHVVCHKYFSILGVSSLMSTFTDAADAVNSGKMLGVFLFIILILTIISIVALFMNLSKTKNNK